VSLKPDGTSDPSTGIVSLFLFIMASIRLRQEISPELPVLKASGFLDR
jgi:hypothetical protein